MPSITGVHHLSLTVRDIQRSAAFYEQVFGFVQLFSLPDDGARGEKFVMAHGDSRTIIGFTAHSSNDGSGFSEFRTGMDHVAFGVSGKDELDAWTARLDELGIAHSEVTSTPVGHLVSLRDPDNIQIELWANPS